jgi:hypothetical protein
MHATNSRRGAGWRMVLELSTGSHGSCVELVFLRHFGGMRVSMSGGNERKDAGR